MTWRLIYLVPCKIFRALPAVLKTHGQALIAFSIVWIGLLFFWHRFDYETSAWAHHHSSPFWLPLAYRTSSWGELQRAPLIALALLAGVGWIKKWSRFYWAAAGGAVAGLVAGILVNLVKFIFGRPRPSTGIADGIYWFKLGWDHQSFPSGHATHCCAIATAVGLLLPRAAGFFWVGALFVMWSRWYSERHYVSDLWGGAGLGIVIGLLIGWSVRAVMARAENGAAGLPSTEKRS